MAASYQTDEEQVEALKKWWAEHGKSTVISVVVAVAAVLGWQGWQKQQQAEIDAASAVYQNLLTATMANNGQLTQQQSATANHLADTLKSDFSNTTYADFAALYKAKFAVANNDLAAAEQELRWILAGGASPEITIQANLRLARVLYAQEQFAEALKQLDMDAGGYASAFEEVRGDILTAQGDLVAASMAYQKSMELALQADPPMPNPLLSLKIQHLNSLLGTNTPQAVADAVAVEGDE